MTFAGLVRLSRGLAALAAAVLLIAPMPASAQGKKVKAGVAIASFPVSVAMYSSLPRALGYWKDEGLDVDVIGVAGSSITMQMILTGQLDFAFPGIPTYLATRAQADQVSSYYCLYSKNQYRIGSLPGSRLKTLQDLKGAKVGVTDLASASVVYTKAVLQSAGIDPDTVEFLPMTGAPAAMANGLVQKTVDGFSSFDSTVGGIEGLLDVKLQIIKTPYDDKVGCGLILTTRRDLLDRDPDAAVGVARGIAKATAFALANPEAAIRLHWRTYPETKPTSSGPEAMRAALSEIKARLETMKVDRASGEKWGDVAEPVFQFYQEFLAKSGEIKQVMPFTQAFDRRLIDRINDWDEAAVAKQAREYKVD
jgi:NitT/TauT family transport system substrate-binding protein